MNQTPGLSSLEFEFSPLTHYLEWVPGRLLSGSVCGGGTPPLCASSSQRCCKLESAVPLFRRGDPGSQRFQGQMEALALGQSDSASGALFL